MSKQVLPEKMQVQALGWRWGGIDDPAMLFSIIASLWIKELFFGGEKGGRGVHDLSLMFVTPDAAPVKVNIAEIFGLTNDSVTSFCWKRGQQEIAPCFSSW